MPYRPPKEKGLGFKRNFVNRDMSREDQEFARQNDTFWGPSPGDAERFEKRNAENKHRPRGPTYTGEEPMTSDRNRYARRAEYQRRAASDPSWESADRQEGAVKFEEDFQAAMDAVPGIYDDPDDYSLVNYARWKPIRDRFLARAREYGLSEEEAEDIMNSFAED
jgi:hypothetical protein